MLRTPQDHDDAQPRAWCNTFDNDVARDFKEDIRNEEHKQSNVVVMPCHIEVLDHALDLRIACWCYIRQFLWLLVAPAASTTHQYSFCQGTTGRKGP